MDRVERYLEKRSRDQKNKSRIGVVIFDFDGTLVVGGDKEYYEPKEEIVELAKKSRDLGFHNIILTARPKESHLATKINAGMYKIPYSRMITNDNNEPLSFKRRIRNELEDKHDIILTIGDRDWDLKGSGANTATVKILKNGYDIFIPE